METVRDRVKAVLKRTGWSQRELARRAGLAESHVSLIVTRLGDNVRPETLRSIAEAAGVSFSWLLTGEGDPDSVPNAVAPTPSPAVTSAVEPEHPTDPAPPAIRVEPASESPLERALGAAFDHTRVVDPHFTLHAIDEDARITGFEDGGRRLGRWYWRRLHHAVEATQRARERELP